MAVEKSKVIVRLKALFPKANLSQKRLDAIADKLAQKPADDADDTAIDAVINDFNSILSFEDIAKEDDRLRTLESKAKDPNPNPNPIPEPNPNPNPQPAPEAVPAWAKAMMESNQKLLQKVETLESGKILENKTALAKSAFEKSEVFKNASEGVKSFWLKNIDVDSETSFEDQVKELETTYSSMVQNTADNGKYPGPAGGGNKTTEADEKMIGDVVNNLV